VRIAKLDFSAPTLDEVFLRYTGARMRTEEVAAYAETSMSAGLFAGRRGGRR
jgi:hypothetical protein